MSKKHFASETEEVLQQLLTSKDDGIIKKILGLLCPTRIISSVDIEIIKTIDYTNKISCQNLEKRLIKINPNPPQSLDQCTGPCMIIDPSTGAIKKAPRNILG